MNTIIYVVGLVVVVGFVLKLLGLYYSTGKFLSWHQPGAY